MFLNVYYPLVVFLTHNEKFKANESSLVITEERISQVECDIMLFPLKLDTASTFLLEPTLQIGKPRF